MRVVLTTILFLSAAVAAATSCVYAQEFEIRLEVNGEQSVGELSIDDESATATTDDVEELFDLKAQRWRQDESKQWVTLADSEAWAKLSKEKSSSSKTSVPEGVRKFAMWCLDPEFEITQTDGMLTMISGQVDYRIDVRKSDKDLTNFFRYARLNAYKKAMTLRKIPPFVELRVLEELERRKLMPISMEIKVVGIPKAPTFKTTYTPKTK